MPGRYKNVPADDYESDDLEATDTLIGRNRTISTAPKKKPRPASAGKKKTAKRPVTPRSSRRPRPHSAGVTRSGRELWMTAVKNRQTVGLSSNRRPHSPRHKTASEYWIDTLRKTGQGISTESTGMNTFSGKRPRDRDMPYLSTPHHLRQMVGTEKAGRNNDPTTKASPGTPAYKSQEEYYDQILEYKRQAAAMNQEASNLKAKIRRLEEDNLKKEKEIDGLLNPQKSEELRRTLADKRPDSGAVIHSLKQKILKLETQMREKESSYIKLQSDLKTTKVEEMRQQMEVFYQEIVRLQTAKETGMDKSARHVGRDGTVKVKALNETIIRLTKSNEQLQSENRGLKEDLKNAMEDSKDRSPSREYADMNRKELLREITSLERKVDRLERRADVSSVVSYESKTTHAPGKIALEGSLEDRLDQLDKRESELLEQIEKNKNTIKQLRAENSRYKRRCEELEKILQDNRIEYRPERLERGERRSPGARRPLSGRTTDRPRSARSESERPYSARLNERPRSSERPRSTERPRSGRPGSGRPSSGRRRDSMESQASSGRQRKIAAFTENRSAKTIQRQWRSHQQDKRQQNNQKVERFRQEHAAKKIQRGWTSHQAKKIEYEREEASETIRSALLGHNIRKKQMKNFDVYDDEDESDYVTDDENYNFCADLIRSSVKGHATRKNRMRDFNFSSTGDEDDDDILQSPSRSLVSSQRPVRPHSPSLHRSRPQSGKSRPSITSSKTTASAMPRTTTYAQPHTSKYNIYDDDDF